MSLLAMDSLYKTRVLAKQNGSLRACLHGVGDPGLVG